VLAAVPFLGQAAAEEAGVPKPLKLVVVEAYGVHMPLAEVGPLELLLPVQTPLVLVVLGTIISLDVEMAAVVAVPIAHLV